MIGEKGECPANRPSHLLSCCRLILRGMLDMSDVAIRMRHLTRDFGPVRAVDDVTFEVPAGIIFGFLGANGAGKTTTIHLLLGLLEPTAGGAEVLGCDIRTQGQQIREQTGALLEFTGLYERLTARENLEFYGRVWHMRAAARQTRIQELLTHFGLWDRRDDRVGTWSRGMKQKLAVARALFHHPRLVFFDEPTAGLDPVAAASLRDDMAALAAREGVTVFLTTHNLPEAERLCSLVGVVRQGKLLALGAPDQLRTQTGTPRVEVFGEGFGESALAALRARPDVAKVALENGHLLIDLHTTPGTPQPKAAPLVEALVQAGAQIEEVRRGQASLEDVFLSLMEEDRTQAQVPAHQEAAR
jgi:ABC-2 type transport system ATP-binding protein